MAPTPVAKPRGSVVGRFFRNPDTGEVVVAQMPNVPLWTFLAAAVGRRLFDLHGTVATLVTVVGTGSLITWAVLEAARGDSPFRRVLGGVVLVAVVGSLLLRHAA